MELPVTPPVVQCALRGTAWAHVTAGTPRRVHPPVSFGKLLARENPHTHVGPGGESVLAVSVPEFLPDDAIGRKVRGWFGGGAPCALPDAGWRVMSREGYTVRKHARATAGQGRGA